MPKEAESPKSREIVANLLSPFRDFIDDGETVQETDENKRLGFPITFELYGAIWQIRRRSPQRWIMLKEKVAQPS